jgi:hypothetical protein
MAGSSKERAWRTGRSVIADHCDIRLLATPGREDPIAPGSCLFDARPIGSAAATPPNKEPGEADRGPERTIGRQ